MNEFVLANEDLKKDQELTRERMLASGSSEEEIDAYFKSQMRDPKYGMGFSHDFPKLTSEEQKYIAELKNEGERLEVELFLIREQIKRLQAKERILLEKQQKNNEKICGCQGHRLETQIHSTADSFLPGYTYRNCYVCKKGIFPINIGPRDCVVRRLIRKPENPTIQC